MDFSTRKITQTIQLLENEEIKKFLTFLSSPYFVKEDQGSVLISLFETLTHYLIDINNPNIPEIELAQCISCNSSLSIGKMEKLLSNLNSLIINFLGLQRISKSNLLTIHAASELRNRNAHNLWQSLVKKLDKTVIAQKVDNFEISVDRISLQFEKYNFKQFKTKENTQDDFTRIIKGFDNFYISNMLKLAIQILSHNKFVLPDDLESQFVALQVLLENENVDSQSKERTVLVMTFNLLRASDMVEIQPLINILTFLDKHEQEIQNETITNIRTIVKNYAITMYNLGNLAMGGFIFDMYKQGIAKGWIFQNGKIQIASVFNIIHCAINEKEFEWAGNFIKKTEDKILEFHLRDFSIALIKSKVLFAKKDFQEAIDILNFNVTDPSFKGMARILEIKILYETNSLQLEHKLEAFKIYMHRIKKAKITPWFHKGHNSFIGILRSINHPKTDFDLKRIEKIKKKILDTEILAEKKWLIEKIDEKAANLKK